MVYNIIFVLTFILMVNVNVFADTESQLLVGESETVIKEAIKKLKDEAKKLSDECEEIQVGANQFQKEISEEEQSIALKTEQIGAIENEIKKLKERPAKYKVIKGDCLWVIAKIEKVYGDPYKWKKIYLANKDKIKDPDLIYPDQVFDIPRAVIGAGWRPTEYEVIPGDCLWKIAGLDKIYGDPYQWPKIYKANKDLISSPELIYPYQIFDIPR